MVNRSSDWNRKTIQTGKKKKKKKKKKKNKNKDRERVRSETYAFPVAADEEFSAHL